VSEAWRDTTITFRASGIAGALGLYFRGVDGNNAYMWQINQSEGALRPHIKSNGGFTVLQPTPFPAGFNFNALHRYTIKVSGNTITTLVDDQVFDVRTSTAFSGPGIGGFRTNGDERGVIRDMSVTSSDGEVLLNTTFAAGDRTFTGGTVSGGTLRLAGNVEAWLAKGTEVPILRTEFDLDKPVASARVYASARGVYELRLNGEKVGDQELAPGWSDYRRRIAYQSYDVTDQLAAGGIGRDEDAALDASRYEDIKAAFAAAFISADGTVRGDSQTAYILTIINDLIPDGMADKVTAQFVQALERRNFHLSTGFLGVDGLLPALTKVGRSDIAYRLLQNEDYPSWGYEIGKGATTIWERWNSIMPDGSFGPVGMNSFNHYAYGAVGEWMYRTMAGVSALEPGYSRILIAPVAGAGIDEVDYRFDSSYGTIGSSWSTDAAGTMTLNVVVPPNTTAEVRVPAPSAWAVREGGLPVREVGSVEFLGHEAGHVRLAVGSGSYAFTVDPTLGQIGDGAASVGPIRAA